MNHSSTKAAAASVLPSFNFGNGLVEIGALTTLIGSSTAGSLVLGNRGSAGLVWGTITAFGSSTVIRACASAACPSWLRQMLGLRTTTSDGAVGMDLSLAPNSKVSRRVRSTLDNPLGVSCNSDDPDQIRMEKSPMVKEHYTYRDIYAFDRATSVMLEELTTTSPGSPLTVYTHYPYPFFRFHNMRSHLSILGLSMLKCFEIYVLLLQGGVVIGLLSAVPFAFSFLAAACLEMHDISVYRRPVETDGHLDIVVGALPTTKRLGGPKKVVIGATKTPRTSLHWRLFWVITGVLQSISLVMSYFLLGQQKTQVVLTWAGFQFAWAILRIFIFHLTDSSDPMANRPMVGRPLETLSSSMKLRVANLVLAVGTYQMHFHPRAMEAYNDDSFSTRQIARLLALPNMSEAYPLPEDDVQVKSSTKVNILAVIGDTALSSAAWMVGSKLTPMDLYDSCIVVFDLPANEKQPHKTIAIPAARVYSAQSVLHAAMPQDSESAEPLFIPRGAGTRMEIDKQTWIYWIPCDNGLWLQIKGKDSTVLGKQSAEVMDDRQLSNMLGTGNLNISLKHAEEVKGIVHISLKATNHLLSFLH